MKSKSGRIIFGGLLILLGVILFIQSLLGFNISGLIVPALFLVGGGVFFYLFANNQEQWWALIPGFTLLGIGGLTGMGELAPRFASIFGGAFFLAMIGLSFLVIFILHREYWWAVIPAGVLFTLALMTLAGQANGSLSGALFFLGLAVTFGVLGLMPVGQKDKWPWIPAGACAVLALVLAIGSGIFNQPVFALLGPAILIVVGVYLIVRSARQH